MFKKLFSAPPPPSRAVKKELEAIKDKGKEGGMKTETTETVKEIPQELINRAEQLADKRIGLNRGGEDRVANNLASDPEFRKEYIAKEAKRLMGMSEHERELYKPAKTTI
ncbi:hypothetical protein A3A09_00005 [Candidatus Nomurabacteria bacterium RIFCSPLOWO2_01_FULL_42_20]|uniref:Uncharacterized protein n=1 Tax=Candidatus Nomurabacteria bacterium RIFCSPHIGHO2_01_FULL_42_16 TaxID=1801743 RepID=A0A1F6VL55_9BACT|nr:MAG: hypothetical protein A2824_02325 [Candidatus Nomurabacteria bacterium RIFCSPHIGHO2_01_FULL_42_16]OGI92192.1 MAG: hypothetical protein A3A09_00005 [Candidatus Nomurabacteria bacterium RIFCSPLOWO2_01_FULL_42_20]